MFRKLLVPLDRSSLAEHAVGPAASIAKKANAGIDIVLVHRPVPYDGLSDVPWYGEQWKDELKYLESIAKQLETESGIFVTFAAPEGDVVDEICKRVVEVDADLIVMTSHGRTGLSRAWLGSIADGVIRHAKIPVLMLRPVETKADEKATHEAFKHLLITLDGSTLSEEILSPALALAKCEGSSISLVRVVQPVPMVLPDAGLIASYSPSVPDAAATQTLVDEAKQQMSATGHRLSAQGFKVDAHVLVSSQVAAAILEFAEKHGVDLVALSTHGRGASRLVMGSVADKVIRASGLPVLLQRPVGVRNVERLAAEPMAEAASPAVAHA
ncbi:MAG TPA: universal stress protein [Gemmatimonadaceae bacterium]|nr:universal stress protein [Gemmatimonadaceae bacterium]